MTPDLSGNGLHISGLRIWVRLKNNHHGNGIGHVNDYDCWVLGPRGFRWDSQGFGEPGKSQEMHRAFASSNTGLLLRNLN